jgi:hypothetical protein
MALKAARELWVSGSEQGDHLIDASANSDCRGFRAGAHGIVGRDEPFEALCKCIYAVHHGQYGLTVVNC